MSAARPSDPLVCCFSKSSEIGNCCLLQNVGGAFWVNRSFSLTKNEDLDQPYMKVQADL